MVSQPSTSPTFVQWVKSPDFLSLTIHHMFTEVKYKPQFGDKIKVHILNGESWMGFKVFYANILIVTIVFEIDINNSNSYVTNKYP